MQKKCETVCWVYLPIHYIPTFRCCAQDGICKSSCNNNNNQTTANTISMFRHTLSKNLPVCVWSGFLQEDSVTLLRSVSRCLAQGCHTHTCLLWLQRQQRGGREGNSENIGSCITTDTFPAPLFFLFTWTPPPPRTFVRFSHYLIARCRKIMSRLLPVLVCPFLSLAF